MEDLLFALVYFGLAGFLVGLAAGFVAPGWRRRTLVLALTGAFAFLAWNAFWIWWATGSCGPGCARDPSLLILFSPLQLLGWALGVAAGTRLRRRRERQLLS